MKRGYFLLLIIVFFASERDIAAGPLTAGIREAAEVILKKFGKGVAGKTVGEISESAAKIVAKHGDEALPILRKAGHAGFTAFEEAGEKAPELIKLYARKGDEAIWLISKPNKLAIFIKHGDDAAEALIKHPGIADKLIGNFGDDAAKALAGVSRQSAQRLSIAAEEGVLSATPRSKELLEVVRKYGDNAMDFIWKNKGALLVTAGLYTFLKDPETYISGAKSLIVEPLLTPIVKSTNWTLIISGILVSIAGYIGIKRWLRKKTTPTSPN